MRRPRYIFLGLVIALAAGCSPKEVTPLQRKQGASFASEADFAVTLRDYPRAEGLLLQAVAVCPDSVDYWLGLGTVRRRMDNRTGAKDGYEQALKASRDASKRDAKNPQPLLQQAYILALLGRVDEARAVVDKARAAYPDNPNIRAFVEGHELDRLLADPGFKALAL